MFQLVVIVMAVALASVLVVAGVPYFDSSTGMKLKTQHILQGEFEGIVSAASAYKNNHGGFLPPDNISALAGLLPNGSVPVLSEDRGVIWSLAAGSICLSRDNADAISDGVQKGINAFAQNIVKSQQGVNVFIGSSCTEASPSPVTSGMSFQDMVKNNQISIIFKGI